VSRGEEAGKKKKKKSIKTGFLFEVNVEERVKRQ
jgi:hypothetical protein